ncbi:MAG: cytosine permease [Bacillota bacterium]|nr:cytosine permease [Bacillota bacterium]
MSNIDFETNKDSETKMIDSPGMGGTDQDVYEPIKESQRVNWPTMLMIFVGMWVSMYSVNIGMAVGQSMAVIPAISATVIGYAIAGLFAAAIGLVGQKTGLSSYVLAKGPLNWTGQMLISFIMFLTIGVGSIGLQADTVGRAIGETIPAIGYSPIVSGIVCAIMMITAILGVKYMGKVSWVTMPFFFVLSIIATWIAVRNAGGWEVLRAIENDTMSFSRAVFLNAGAWAGFVMLMPDVSRFLKTKKEVLTVIPIAFVIGSVPPVCGVILGAALGTSLDQVFVSLGIGIVGLLAVIGIGWTTNDNNAYTAGLALTTAIYPFKKLTRRKVTTIVAVIGVIGAMTGLGNLGFITWIAGFHGSFNMSFVGVLIAHYLVVSKDKYIQTKGVAGIISWLVSGLLTYFDLLPLPFLSAAFLGFALYLAIYYGVEKKIYGENVVDSITPKIFKEA